MSSGPTSAKVDPAGVDVRIELEPMQNSRGDRTEVRIARAVNARADAPAIVWMPAMGVAARFYDSFARALARRGFSVVYGDLRGTGASEVQPARGTDFDYTDLVRDEFPAVFARARERFPGSPLIAAGHSLGGQLSALHLALEPASVAGLILVASCSVHWLGWPPPVGVAVLAATQAAGLVARALGHFPGHRLGFGGLQARGVIVDWARQSRTGRYALREGPDVEHALAQVTAPVFAVDIEGDTYAPRAAIERLLAKLPNARITRWHFDPGPARRAKIGHFHWASRAPDEVAAAIAEWLAATWGV